MMRNWLSAIFILFSTILFAAPVHVEGTAVGYEGKTMTLLSYRDQLTRSLQIEGQCVVDSTGRFSIDFETDEIKMIKLRCFYVNANLYVQPDASYDLVFPELGADRVRTFNNTAHVEVLFENLDPEDINAKIIAFNGQYDQFFRSNVRLLHQIQRPATQLTDENRNGVTLRQKMRNKLDGFSTNMDSIFGNEKKDFFYVFRKCAEADMYMNTDFKPKEIYDQYVTEYTIDLNNTEQMRLFSQFYNEYFAQFGEKFGLDDLKNALTKEEPLAGTLAELAKDDFMSDMDIRKIVLAYTIFTLKDSKKADFDNYLKVLEALTKDENVAVSQLAQDILDNGIGDIVGRKVNFEWVTDEGNIMTLDSLEAPFLVLEFWASWCEECLSEMMLSSQLQETYKDRFQFLSISFDEQITDMNVYLDEQSNLNQQFAHFGQDPLIQDRLVIRSLPQYFILDKNREIISAHANKPSEILEQTLHRLNQNEIKKENEKKSNLRKGY